MKKTNGKTDIESSNSAKSLSKQEISEIAGVLSKSMYKAVMKAIHNRGEAKEVIEDVLDPDNVAEVDPDKIPSGKKVHVTNKSETDKVLKSVDKLRLFLGRKKTQ